MNKIGKPERETPNRVVALFQKSWATTISEIGKSGKSLVIRRRNFGHIAIKMLRPNP
jgi:hypothetical protein